jgi:hypothetical protein
MAIPKLVIVKQNREVITHRGQKQIWEQGLHCFQSWVEPASYYENKSK